MPNRPKPLDTTVNKVKNSGIRISRQKDGKLREKVRILKVILEVQYVSSRNSRKSMGKKTEGSHNLKNHSRKFLRTHRDATCWIERAHQVSQSYLAGPGPEQGCLGPAVLCGFLTSCRKDFTTPVQVSMRVRVLKLGTVKQGRA